jgi:hypothetical protein
MRFRTVLVVSILIFAALFSSGCSCGCGKTEPNTVKGFITVIGNEPFTKIAVKTDEGKFFVLKGSKELNAELNQKQGSYYVIQYVDLKTEDGNEVLIVEKAIPLKNESK